MSINIEDVLDKLTSHALAQGVFDQVNAFEPKAAPGRGITAALWCDRIQPINTSGLQSTSILLTYNLRIYTNMLSAPQDTIDPNLIASVDIMCAAYSADFDLGGTSREIDLLGAYSQGLSAQAGYINQDGQVFRCMTLIVPVVINDVWSQEVEA
jgi:hypothetical protein